MDRIRHWLAQWWQRRMPPSSRVRLGQRQIFIIPTLTGVAFAAALLLMLLVAINYQNSLAYALAFLLASLGLLTALHTWRNLAGLELSAQQPVACFSGDQALFRVQLETEGLSRYGIALGWQATVAKPGNVMAGQGSEELVLSLPAHQRGWLKAPRIRVETRFPLGIWVAWSWVGLDMQTLVYPQPLEAELPMLAAKSEDDNVDGQQDSMQGADDYQGLTAWQQGDSLRRVDWKAWSRGQGLWVKQFSGQQGQETELDYSHVPGDSERRLSTLCFHVLRLDAADQPYSLQLPGQQLGPDSGVLHRDACLRALALFGKEFP